MNLRVSWKSLTTTALTVLPLKGTKAAAGEDRCRILNGEVDPQVRLVGAVLLHGLGVGDAHKGRGAGRS